MDKWVYTHLLTRTQNLWQEVQARERCTVYRSGSPPCRNNHGHVYLLPEQPTASTEMGVLRRDAARAAPIDRIRYHDPCGKDPCGMEGDSRGAEKIPG